MGVHLLWLASAGDDDLGRHALLDKPRPRYLKAICTISLNILYFGLTYVLYEEIREIRKAPRQRRDSLSLPRDPGLSLSPTLGILVELL